MISHKDFLLGGRKSSFCPLKTVLPGPWDWDQPGWRAPAEASPTKQEVLKTQLALDPSSWGWAGQREDLPAQQPSVRSKPAVLPL